MRILSDIRRGITVGLYFAFFFTAVALLIFAVSGESPFKAKGLTIAETIAYYLIAGIVAGAVAGMLQRFGKNYGGAVLIGIVTAGVAAIALYSIKVGPFWAWDSVTWISTAVAAIFFGWLFGHVIYRHRKVLIN